MIHIYNTFFDDHIPYWHNRNQQVQYHILALITDGKLTYRLNGRPLQASKGDLLLIPAGTEREAINAPEGTHQKYAVMFRCELPGLPLVSSTEHALIQSDNFEYYKERILLIHRHSLEQGPYNEVIGNGILLELLGTLHRELATPAMPLRKLTHVRLLKEYILEHFREAITLRELGGLIDRSPNYTLALFKEATGKTPHAYIQDLRVSTAMELLQHTNLTVSAISAHLGFYDTSYFHKVFRRRTGMSPSHYATSRKTGNDAAAPQR
ncbi:AraC family transcriptional regulator [Paenibacillus sp. 1P07SE]|uniref:AraC family transcriptional regulator n=1 Tax=Paenibacillus sp. 1P07SE TaxID=3132209 RepID=UPI0039A693A4